MAPGPALSMRRLGCGIGAGLRIGPDVLRQDDARCLLRVRVSDDGAGGARIEAGSGLAGLAERLRTMDGTMQITSPPSGRMVVRAGMAEILADRGYVVTAVGAADALRAAVAQHHPDVTVVDVRMPPSRQTDGLTALTARERDVLALMAERRSRRRDCRHPGRLRAGRRKAHLEHFQQARSHAIRR
jgi:CheY-like chemotaxis protein